MSITIDNISQHISAYGNPNHNTVSHVHTHPQDRAYEDANSDTSSDAYSETMSWIDDETTEEEFYGAFYNSPIESVQVVQMLISSDGQSCLGVSRACCQLATPGVMTPEELIPIIKCQTSNGFKVVSVTRFSLQVDAANINDFVMTDNNSHDLTEETYTNNIVFPESVKALEPTATIFILYSRNPPKSARSKRRQTRVAGRTHPRRTTRKSVSFPS